MSFGYNQAEGESSSESRDVTPEQIAELRDPFANALRNIYTGGPGSSYTGPLTSSMTGGQTSAISNITNQANDPTRQAYLRSVMQGNFLPGQPGANPFFDAAVQAAQRPTLQGLQETLTRSLPGRFNLAGHQINSQHGAGGGGSSAFDRAGAIATRGAADAIGDIATNMGNQQYGQERGLQNQAAALSQQEIQGLNTALQAESLPQMIEDMGVQRGMQQFNERMRSLLQALAMIATPISQHTQTSQSTNESMGVTGDSGIRFTPR